MPTVRPPQRRITTPTTATTSPSTKPAERNVVRSADGVDAPKKAKSVDGEAFCKAALADIKLRTSRGEKVCVVFDIDDTLADTRARTLSIAKAYDKANGTAYFKGLSLSEVQRSGGDTAKAMKLPPDVVKAFTAYWDVEFWKGEALVHDKPLKKIIELAKAADAAGADVRYLTGRVDGNRASTLEQLKRFGLPDAENDNLFCKPGLNVRTVEYKEQVLESFLAEGTRVGFFMTESRRDTAWLQAQIPGMPSVLLSTRLEAGGEAVRADTPIFDSVIKSRLPE